MLGNGFARFDGFQQRHAWLGFPLAVRQKYADDQGGYLSAVIAYYAFFAVLPLLFVLVTVLAYVLHGDAKLQHEVLNSALAEFPVVGDQLHKNVQSLNRSGLALALGTAAALWAGMNVSLAVENAMNHAWGIEFRRRPNPLLARLRGVLLLLVLGAALLVSTLLGSLATLSHVSGVGGAIAGVIVSLAVNLAVFLLAFRVLTSYEPGWRELLPGALTGAGLWEALQIVGAYYIDHVVRHASTLYGFFAIIIGLMSWLYLGAQVTIFSAELNVVVSRRLWPRSLSIIREEPLTTGDELALRQRAGIEQRRADENVTVDFDDPPPADA